MDYNGVLDYKVIYHLFIIKNRFVENVTFEYNLNTIYICLSFYSYHEYV